MKRFRLTYKNYTEHWPTCSLFPPTFEVKVKIIKVYVRTFLFWSLCERHRCSPDYAKVFIPRYIDKYKIKRSDVCIKAMYDVEEFLDNIFKRK